MIDADRFWPNGDADAREWDLGRSEWRKMCRLSYQRVAGEYALGNKSVHLLTHEQMRESSIPLEDSPVWGAVRGTDFVSANNWGFESGVTHEVSFELVPTPKNPNDICAVAVELDGKKLGNLSAGYARYAHWKIRQLNYHGYRVFTAGFYRSFCRSQIGAATPEAFVAMPDFAMIDSFLNELLEPFPDFRQLWDVLPVEVQDAVREDSYHLTDWTAEKVLAFADRFPALTLPLEAEASAFPREFDLVLRAVREMDTAARQAAREAEQLRAFADDCSQVRALIEQKLTRREISEALGMTPGRVSRAIKELGLVSAVHTRQPSQISDERRAEVIRRSKEGQSNSSIEREMGLGKGRASKILAANGMSSGAGLSGGLSDHHRELMRERLKTCLRALELQRGGMTRAQIARELGVSESSIQTRLSDARFFDDPHTNPNRLQFALDVRGALSSGILHTPTARARGLSDGNMLDLLGYNWRD